MPALFVSRTRFQTIGFRLHNASGVVPVGRLRFAFIDNQDAGAVFEFTLRADGTLQGPVRPRLLVGLESNSLSDPEGLALVDVHGEHFLIVASSLSMRPFPSPGEPAAHQGLLRIRHTPAGDLRAEVMTGFRGWLLEHYPRFEPAARKIPDRDGLNIEGLAWDPVHSDLLLGVRSPTVDGRVSVVRLRLDVEAPWTVAALQAGPVSFIQRPTNPPQGVRDISYDADRNEFLVLLGRSITGGGAAFQLCTWDGVGTAADVLNVEFESTMKPEGVTVVNVDGVRQVVIVDDAGGFATFKAEDVPGWS
jgi:hypothetical protein